MVLLSLCNWTLIKLESESGLLAKYSVVNDSHTCCRNKEEYGLIQLYAHLWLLNVKKKKVQEKPIQNGIRIKLLRFFTSLFDIISGKPGCYNMLGTRSAALAGKRPRRHFHRITISAQRRRESKIPLLFPLIQLEDKGVSKTVRGLLLWCRVRLWAHTHISL